MDLEVNKPEKKMKDEYAKVLTLLVRPKTIDYTLVNKSFRTFVCGYHLSDGSIFKSSVKVTLDDRNAEYFALENGLQIVEEV